MNPQTQAGMDIPLTATRPAWYQYLHGKKQGSIGRISESEKGGPKIVNRSPQKIWQTKLKLKSILPT